MLDFFKFLDCRCCFGAVFANFLTRRTYVLLLQLLLLLRAFVLSSISMEWQRDGWLWTKKKQMRTMYFYLYMMGNRSVVFAESALKSCRVVVNFDS